MILPLLATVAGYALFGWWGIAGGIVGALAAFAAHGAGAGIWVRALAATLPPLTAAGPTILLVAALLGLVLAWQRTDDPRVFLFGALALFAPAPEAAFVTIACGALLVATGRGRWLAAGVALCFASWLVAPGELPLAPALALGLALLARALATHPANASVARGLLGSAALLLCLPAFGGIALVALGVAPETFRVLLVSAIALALGGGLLFAAQAGLAVFHVSDARAPALWSALTWAPAVGVMVVLDAATGGTSHRWELFLPLSGLMAVAFAVGARWLASAATRQEVPGKS